MSFARPWHAETAPSTSNPVTILGSRLSLDATYAQRQSNRTTGDVSCCEQEKTVSVPERMLVSTLSGWVSTQPCFDFAMAFSVVAVQSRPAAGWARIPRQYPLS